MPTTDKAERILVLCVDRDDDLGMKAGIETPVLGRKENVNAAASLALRDPEEADANAMFEAVRIYDNLKKSAKANEEHEVATIAGSDLHGVEADRQVVAELTEVLNEFPATDVILVTDGYADEMVLPLIESRVPVTSVRRIVIQHSKSIEETAALFTRYMKILVDNPRYSRMLLGLPGILFVVLGIIAFYPEYSQHALSVLAVIIGLALFVRGFRIDKAAGDFYKWVQDYSPPPFVVQIAGFAAIAGVLLIFVGCFLGGTAVATAFSELTDPFTELPSLFGKFLYEASFLVGIGINVMLTGRAIKWFFERDLRLWRTIVIMFAVGWSSVIFFLTSDILINPESANYTTLVYAIVVGIPVIVATVSVVLLLRRKYSSFFNAPEDELEELD